MSAKVTKETQMCGRSEKGIVEAGLEWTTWDNW